MKILSVVCTLTAVSAVCGMKIPPAVQIPQNQPSVRKQLSQLSPPCIKKGTSKYNIMRGILDSYLLLHEIIEMRNSYNWDLDALTRDSASSERYEDLLKEFAQNVHEIEVGTLAGSKVKKKPNRDYSSLQLLKQAEDVLRNEKKKQVVFFMAKLGGWIEDDIDNNFGQKRPSYEGEYIDEFARIRELYSK